MILFQRSNPTRLLLIAACLLSSTFLYSVKGQPAPFELTVNQITSGKKHHIFGYIGQCRTIPWNASGRYILGLELDFIDRMPNPEDAATVFIIDTLDEWEYFDLEKDPNEINSLYRNPEFASDIAEMKAKLATQRSRLKVTRDERTLKDVEKEWLANQKE